MVRPCTSALPVAALLFATTAGAQGPPPTIADAAAPASHCVMGSTAVRAFTGGAVGAWLGFVAAKIKMSDWNAESRAASAARTRNVATISGAVIGALAGSLVHVKKPCGATALAGSGTAAPAGRQPITAAEITRSGISGSVYDVVYSLRRQWLNTRGINSMTEGPIAVPDGDTEKIVPAEAQLVVYLDNMKLGTLTELKRLPIGGVTAIRYFNPSEANYLWGPGHIHGAIQVMTIEPSEP